MKVFISWSGMISKYIAKFLKKNLEEIFDNENFETFMSEEDITAGSNWFQVIKDELESSDCAIICITKDNINAPWINFEGGAIAMQHKETHVIPFLIDTDLNNYDGPFKNYHHIKLSLDGYKKILKDIKKIGNFTYLSNKNLEILSEKYFLEFDGKVQEVLEKHEGEYIDNPINIFPSYIKLLKRNKVFIGAPMASLSDDDYKILRQHILEIENSIKTYCGFNDITYSGFKIEESSQFEGEEKAIKKNFKYLKESEFFIFIYPDKIASSVLVEMGYAIALSKKTIIFTRSKTSLPFMLREVDKAINSFKIYTYSDYSDITRIIALNGSDLFT